MPSSFAALIFLPGEGPEFAGLVDWYGEFLKRTFPTVDGAVDVHLLLERAEAGDSAVAVQRWRDRESYEAYRSDSGQESAKKLLPLKQQVEYALPVASLGDPEGAGMHFLVRIESGPKTPEVVLQIKNHLETESVRAPGFAGARLWVSEMGDAIVGLLSWKRRDDFLSWRNSEVGARAATFLRNFKPRVWRLSPVAHARGLSFA